MKTVLVTGAAGFIGSHVAERLLARGDRVVALDNMNDYYAVANKQRNLQALSGFAEFHFVEGDLLDRSLIKDLFERFRFTHVAHLAARAGVRPSIEDPFIYEEANVRGTIAFAWAALSSQSPSVSSAQNCAPMNRILDASWVTCLRTKRAGGARLASR